jgi:phenylacetate-CoA ligase
MDIAQKVWEQAYFPFFEAAVKRRSTASLYRASLDSQWRDRADLEQDQLSGLNRLLAHAKSHVPFYGDDNRYPNELHSLQQLAELPLLDKDTIRQHESSLLSRKPGETHWWKSTGGSTGQPLRFAHTPLSHDWRTAMSMRGYSWAGAPPGSKQAYIWGIPTTTPSALRRLKESLHRRLERKRLYNCFAFTPSTMKACYEDLLRWRPDVIVGYTNATYELARFAIARQLPAVKVKAVLCAAEKVHPVQRQAISRAFSCPVFDTYGSREFMLIASECPAHAGLHVSMENLITEVVDDQGLPVKEGATGRLLVTDLHNYAMPFIRYEIGDLARFTSKSCPCGRGLLLLDDIVGRKLDVIRCPEGRVVPGELFPHVIKDFHDIRRFQVIQESMHDIRLLLQSDTKISEDTKQAIVAKLVELVGADMQVHVEIVDSIALTPSGKHRVTISRLSD